MFRWFTVRLYDSSCDRKRRSLGFKGFLLIWADSFWCFYTIIYGCFGSQYQLYNYLLSSCLDSFICLHKTIIMMILPLFLFFMNIDGDVLSHEQSSQWYTYSCLSSAQPVAVSRWEIQREQFLTENRSSQTNTRPFRFTFFTFFTTQNVCI